MLSGSCDHSEETFLEDGGSIFLVRFCGLSTSDRCRAPLYQNFLFSDELPMKEGAELRVSSMVLRGCS